VKIFITQYFPVILSTIALIFSILSFWRTSKRYRVFFNDQIDYYLDSAVYCNDTSGHFIPESAVGYGINFSIDIVNTSPVDIGYFDLVVIDADTHELLPLVTRRSIPPRFRDMIFYRENQTNPLLPSVHHMPEGISGVLKANAVTQWDLFVRAGEDTQHIAVSFCVAMKKPPFARRNPYCQDNFKSFRSEFRVCNVTGWAELAKKTRPILGTSYQEAADRDKNHLGFHY